MKFENPIWLWLLLALPFVYLLLVLDEKRKKKTLDQFIKKDLWKQLIPSLDLGASTRKIYFWVLALAFVLIALARPQFGTREETVDVASLDIMVVLDVSRSMNVEDVVPSRLKRAKHWIRTLSEHLGGDRMGLVAFAGASEVTCPLTTDLDYLLARVDILSTQWIQNQGTDIGAGLSSAIRALERGGEESAHPDHQDASSSAIILISDGEDQEADYEAAVEEIRKKGIKLYVLGVGTPAGGPIPLLDDKGNAQGFKRDRAGQPIISTFNGQALSSIATQAGGKYWNLTPSESEIPEILKNLGALQRTDHAQRRYVIYEDRFQIPLAIAVILLLIELSLPARKLLLLLLLLAVPTAQVKAADSTGWKGPLALDTYLQNEKGLKAFKEGKIEEAQKDFVEAQARDPSRPELEFNQGVVEMQAGATDRAIESFRGSSKLAKDRGDPKLQSKSSYNLGQALLKKGDSAGAVDSYLDAIQSAQQAKDPQLEAAARKNLQLLIEEEKKKQQQKNQDEKNKDQKENKEQKEQQQQNSQGDSEQKNPSGKPEEQKNSEKDKKSSEDQSKEQKDKKGKEEGKEKENEKKSGNDESDKETPDKKPEKEQKGEQTKPGTKKSRKQNFESKKMTADDAERVFSELRTREKELQEKLQKQNAKNQTHVKDW